MNARSTLMAIALVAFMVAGLVIEVPSAMAGMPPDGYSTPKQAKGPPPNKEWAKATKDAEIIDGLFRIYKGKDKWHLQINPDQLDQQYIMSLTVGRGVGSSFPLMGGMTLWDELIRFQKVGSKVLLYKDDPRFVATGDEDLQRAIKLSFGPSVAHSFKVAAEKKDTLLVDITDFLISDYADVGNISRFAMGGPARLDKQRSTLGKLQAFERNVEMEAELTYSPGNRQSMHVRSVADDRWIPITIHYSIVALPEPGYVPRLRDDRIGYFSTTIKDFSRSEEETYLVHYANRWRLEKKDPSAAVSETVKPITFYLENTIPEKWRPYIKRGVERWQLAFEKAGFKNAIVALPQPDDSTFDAADVQYSSIRWISNDQPDFGAIGPSRTDPRTGEIFDADILVEAFWIQIFHNRYRQVIGPETIQEALDGITQKELKLAEELGWESSMCRIGSIAADVGDLLGLAMHGDGLLPPGSPVPDEFIGQTLMFLTMHEVGHTLGLRHNFQSSSAISFEQLESHSYVANNGLTGSVMDYISPLIQGHENPNHIYMSETLGPYDYWAIRYGYTPTAAQSPFEEKALLELIAEECNQPGHLYGTDFDTYPVTAMDPRNNIWDLSNNPLEFGKRRTGYLEALWSKQDFEQRLLAPGDGYQTLRNAMNSMVFQYGRGLSTGLKYVGGQEVSRAHYKDPGSLAPFRPVPASEQRKALQFLTERAFAPSAFSVSPDLLNKMLPDRTSSWATNPYQGEIVYPYYATVLAMQTGVLNRLMEPRRVTRMREAELRQSNALTIAELFDELTGAIWGEFGIGSANAPARRNPSETMTATSGPGTRRDLQRAYVDNLVIWLLNPAAAGTDDARALARLHLTRIDQACERRMNSGSFTNDVLQAHLLETKGRIERALDAEKEAEG